MGRELRRVPLDFNWPLNQIWGGYYTPFHSKECNKCRGTGYSPKVKELADTWYDYQNPGGGWEYQLTQDEVDFLVKEGRLFDFTRKLVKGEGWVEDPDKPHPTAERVNAWARESRMGHDAINRCLCIEARAKRLLGLDKKDPGFRCLKCNGHGCIYTPQTGKLCYDTLVKFINDDEHFKKAQEWEAKGHPSDMEEFLAAKIAVANATETLPLYICDQVYLALAANCWQFDEPPKGEGFQLWETTSEGSPISPVFKTLDDLAEWCASGANTFASGRASKEAWKKMLEDDFVHSEEKAENGDTLISL